MLRSAYVTVVLVDDGAYATAGAAEPIPTG
jgi:hypothetical protein